MFYPPQGLIIALITPFDEKGSIDWVSLRRLIERVLPFGDGLFFGEGMVGEGLSLPNPLRLELLQGATDIVAGKKPLFLCPTADTIEETLSNVEAVGRKYSAQPNQEPFYWVDIPLWYHSNRKLSQTYQEWGKCSPFPILLDNHPHLIARLNRTLKRRNIRTAVLKRLAENEQIVGLIQEGDLKRTMHYQRAVRPRREFRFYDGDEKSFLNQPSSSGVVSAGANLLPAAWKEIVAASLSLAESPAPNRLLVEQSQKLRELSQALGMNPAGSLKFALHRLGWISHPKVLSEIAADASGVEKAMGNFLQENFSLQNPL
jgi:dihydrodipicolinate synthase/N-acetylneuraminate lyase